MCRASVAVLMVAVGAASLVGRERLSEVVVAGK